MTNTTTKVLLLLDNFIYYRLQEPLSKNKMQVVDLQLKISEFFCFKIFRAKWIIYCHVTKQILSCT